MLFLKLLSAIASLFAIYPLLKFARKDEINIFDLIILFHTIFYCLVPIVSDYSAFLWLKDFKFEQNIIFQIFIYYVIVLFLLLQVDIFWTKHYKYTKSILNITYYIKTLPQIEISWVFIVLLLVNLIISCVWYLPQTSILDAFSHYYDSQGYIKTPLYLLYGIIFTLCFSFTLILFLKERYSFKVTVVLVFILIGFTLFLLFMPRRIMLYYLILALIIIYSVKRNFFTLNKLTIIVLILFFVLKVYFPFYNVMRRSNVRIDENNIVSSLIHIVEDATNIYSFKKEQAAETTEGRSLNLYYALYRIIKFDKSPNNGGLLIAAIDHAIPKFINPNKGMGTEIMLQEKMHLKKDQADSILILAYGDFGLIVGAFYSFILFILVISIYVLYYRLNLCLFNFGSTFDILLIVYLISFAWNVEQKLDASFASFVHLAIIAIILMFLNRLNIIRYRNMPLQ